MFGFISVENYNGKASLRKGFSLEKGVIKMNFVVYLSIALLIGNCNSEILSSTSSSFNTNSTSVIEFESDEKSAMFKSHRKSETKTNETKLVDLNSDVIYAIVEQLCLDDLLSLAEVNPMLYSVAVDVFARKYKNCEVDIQHAAPIDSYVGCLKSNEYPRLKRIEIFAFDTIASLLSTFGSRIHRLKIHYKSIDPVISSIVNQLISRHGSDSLTHLDLGEINENTFEQFTVPFKNLEHLSFVVKQTHIKSGQLPLNQLFPKLSDFKLYVQDTDYSFINCEFPHLDTLTLTALFQPQNESDQFAEFLQKNPQIKNIDVNHRSDNFIRVIHAALPNLKRLKLHNLNINNTMIHFEHVTHFVFDDYFPRSLDTLSFAHLEYLEISYYWMPTEWIAFFKNHKNLRQLYVKNFHEEKIGGLIEFIADLTNLVKLTIEYWKHLSIDIEIIRRIFGSHTKLNTFKLLVPLSEDSNEMSFGLDELRTSFENEWNISEIQRSNGEWLGFLFEKRN